MEISQGSVAYSGYHTLGVGMKVSGFVLPDTTAGIINFKCVCPKNIAAIPNAKIRVIIITIEDAKPSADTLLIVSTKAFADTENMDSALIAETKTDVKMPATADTLKYYEQSITNGSAPVSDNIVLGQIKRDPSDSLDKFTGVIMVIGVELIIDRTIP